MADKIKRRVKRTQQAMDPIYTFQEEVQDTTEPQGLFKSTIQKKTTIQASTKLKNVDFTEIPILTVNDEVDMIHSHINEPHNHNNEQYGYLDVENIELDDFDTAEAVGEFLANKISEKKLKAASNQNSFKQLGSDKNFFYELHEAEDDEILRKENKIIGQSKDFRSLNDDYQGVQHNIEIDRFGRKLLQLNLAEFIAKLDEKASLLKKQASQQTHLLSSYESNFSVINEKHDIAEQHLQSSITDEMQIVEIIDKLVEIECILEENKDSFDNVPLIFKFKAKDLTEYKTSQPYKDFSEYKNKNYFDYKKRILDGIAIFKSRLNSKRTLFSNDVVGIFLAQLFDTVAKHSDKIDVSSIDTPLKFFRYSVMLDIYSMDLNKNSSDVENVIKSLSFELHNLSSLFGADVRYKDPIKNLYKILIEELIYYFTDIFVPETDYTSEKDCEMLCKFANSIITLASDSLFCEDADTFKSYIKDVLHNELLRNSLALTEQFQPLSIEEYIHKMRCLFGLFKDLMVHFSFEEIKLIRQTVFISPVEDFSAIKQFSFLSSYKDLCRKIKGH